MPAPTSTHPKTTIYIWPTGLFPRRIIYYLRAQKITLSDLAAQNIHLIPVILDPETYKLDTPEGYPVRPDNMSVPCMHIASSTEEGEGQWIRESLTIIHHLDSIFTSEESQSILISFIHSTPGTESWSQLRESERSAGAAAHATRRKEFYMGRLEEWIKSDVVGKGTKSLSGEGREVTLADVVVMAQTCYTKDGYGADWLEGCEVLKGWWERAITGEWWISGEGLKECEKVGWGAALAE